MEDKREDEKVFDTTSVVLLAASVAAIAGGVAMIHYAGRKAEEVRLQRRTARLIKEG